MKTKVFILLYIVHVRIIIVSKNTTHDQSPDTTELN